MARQDDRQRTPDGGCSEAIAQHACPAALLEASDARVIEVRVYDFDDVIHVEELEQ